MKIVMGLACLQKAFSNSMAEQATILRSGPKAWFAGACLFPAQIRTYRAGGVRVAKPGWFWMAAERVRRDPLRPRCLEIEIIQQTWSMKRRPWKSVRVHRHVCNKFVIRVNARRF
jgi:hypothetical protein